MEHGGTRDILWRLHRIAPNFFGEPASCTVAAGGDARYNNNVAGATGEPSGNVIDALRYVRLASREMLDCHDRQIPVPLRDLYKECIAANDSLKTRALSALFEKVRRGFAWLRFCKDVTKFGSDMMAYRAPMLAPLSRGIDSASLTLDDVFNKIEYDLNGGELTLNRERAENPYFRMFRNIVLSVLSEYVGNGGGNLFRDVPYEYDETDKNVLRRYVRWNAAEERNGEEEKNDAVVASQRLENNNKNGDATRFLANRENAKSRSSSPEIEAIYTDKNNNGRRRCSFDNLDEAVVTIKTERNTTPSPFNDDNNIVVIDENYDDENGNENSSTSGDNEQISFDSLVPRGDPLVVRVMSGEQPSPSERTEDDYAMCSRPNKSDKAKRRDDDNVTNGAITAGRGAILRFPEFVRLNEPNESEEAFAIRSDAFGANSAIVYADNRANNDTDSIDNVAPRTASTAISTNPSPISERNAKKRRARAVASSIKHEDKHHARKRRRQIKLLNSENEELDAQIPQFMDTIVSPERDTGPLYNANDESTRSNSSRSPLSPDY